MSVATLAPPTTIRAAIYTRISSDKEGQGLGVERQEELCRDLATRRGWQVSSVYADNDLSAFSGRVRPAYRRLLDDMRSGTVNAVVAWHQDRLQRDLRELEDFIDIVNTTDCLVETVQSGDINLATYDGRWMARMLGANARRESEHKSARLKAKHQQIAKSGGDGGGGRPFGYEDDRMTIRPKEADLIRDAAKRVLAGESLRSIAMDWNKRGIKSVKGTAWSVKVLKGIVGGARISGRRERGTDAKGKRHFPGEIIAKAVWPPIIPVEESDRLRARLSDPARGRYQGGAKQLLTGGLAVCGNVLCAVCGETHVAFTVDKKKRHHEKSYEHAYVAGKVCGAPLVSRPKQANKKGDPPIPSLVCAKGPGFHGCGGVRIQAEPLTDLVVEAALQAVDAGKLAKALRGRHEDRAAMTELDDVDQRLSDLAEDWATSKITRSAYERARQTLMARHAALSKRVDASRRQVGLDGLPSPLRAAWPRLPLHKQKAIAGALLEAVVVGRGRKGLNKFDARRVTLKWKA